MYKDWKMNIKNLTDLLWDYVFPEEDELEARTKLRKQILDLFDTLEGPAENFHHVQEIRNKIVRDMDANSFDSIEVASYTRDLVIYGYQ